MDFSGALYFKMELSLKEEDMYHCGGGLFGTLADVDSLAIDGL